MKAQDLRNLNWVKLEDWSELTRSEYNGNRRFASKVDIESFVENVFRDISYKLNIPQEEVMKILKEENSAFYKIMDKFFTKFTGLNINSAELEELKKMLRVPDISFIAEPDVKVEKLIEYGLKLSDKEKTKVIDELNLSFKKNPIFNAEKVLEDFSKLPDIEKIEVLKHLSLVEIKVELNPR